MGRIEQAMLLSVAAEKLTASEDVFQACRCTSCMVKSADDEVAFRFDGSAAQRALISALSVDSFDGSIDPAGDFDLYSFDVVAGTTYLVSMTGSGANPLVDAFLVVYDETDTLVDFDDDGGIATGSLITFTAATTGTYTIDASAFAGTGDYTIITAEQGVDDVPDTFAGAVALSGNETVVNFIETSLDIDTYALNLVAGQLYNFELAGGADYNSLFFDLPTGELDTILSLYNSAGVLVARNDDISFPSDISSRISLFVETSGTYYLDVQAFSGQTGGYQLVTQAVDISALDPLDSINWVSADSVDNDVTVYFAQAGEVFDGVTSLGWNAYEMQQTMLALAQYEEFIDIDVTVTNDPTGATFRLVTTENTPFLAYMYPDDPAFGDLAGIGVFARDGFGWNEVDGGGLELGGYGFVTITHEFGHAFGLAHPHDTGGGSEIMAGVTGPFGSYGVYNLNQGVYSQMSYNTGWQFNPDTDADGFPTDAQPDYGFESGPMAFDIAVLQRRYGANTTTGAGNNTYVLPGINGEGTFYDSIWDVGGIDTLRANGSTDAIIDLRAATLDYTPTGGGAISYVDGVFGGFTIANGVVIENATGGGGDDRLLGNAVGNRLAGYGGDDYSDGREGDDTIQAGAGDDTAYGGAGNDRMVGDVGDDDLHGGRGNDNVDGGADDDTVRGDDGHDTVRGGAGDDKLGGGAGNDRLDGGDGDDNLLGGAGDDTQTGGSGADVFAFANGFGDDRILDFDASVDELDFSRLTTTLDGFSSTASGLLFDFADGSSVLLVGVGLSMMSLAPSEWARGSAAMAISDLMV